MSPGGDRNRVEYQTHFLGGDRNRVEYQIRLLGETEIGLIIGNK